MNQPRPYQNGQDFKRMKALLVEGRKAANGTYYVHPGDLSWWLFYNLPEDDLWANIYLWEDQRQGSELLGWTLFSPKWSSFDVFFYPSLRNSGLVEHMFTWSMERAQQMARQAGKARIATVWISEKDTRLSGLLGRCGCLPSPEGLLYLTRSLEGPLPESALPAGFQVRSVKDESEAGMRAAASYAAFESTMPFETYQQRYLRFMRSPVYRSENDLIITAPDGQGAAFCILWLDSTNQVGLFEPVGAHPAHQRKGLGKAVMLEGLRRMQTQGIKTAMVCVEQDNLPAQRLYLSCGFKITDRLITYEKNL
ncbi:MAG: GNAT family N-acetyltransferase [Anaerolineales bacterium]|nr:GNAT family N-acetyltransferase [Anaerolineales bacterium]